MNETRALCVNCGSSSVKVALFAIDDGGERRLASEHGAPGDLRAILGRIAGRVDVVGHRFVHGGPDRFEPALVDDALLRALREAIPFAPLHLPASLDALDVARAAHPGVPQVVCFDTAFHARIPAIARRLPIPESLASRGVHKYGFHGLSYEYVVGALGDAARGRVVIAHLGNGASLAAVKDGACVDTTMGLTPTGGLVMGTRTGDLDPGVIVFALREGRDADAIERLVDRESGLLGVSGTTSDVKTLLARRASDPRADLALSIFAYAVRKGIAAMAAAMDGIDRVVFTGGIGEHAKEMRDEVMGGLAWLGAIDVRVVATDEDLVIARHARRVITRGGATAG